MEMVCNVLEKASCLDCLDLHFRYPIQTKYFLIIRQLSDLVSQSNDNVSLYRVIFCMVSEIEEINSKLASIEEDHIEVLKGKQTTIEDLKNQIKALEVKPELTTKINYADTIRGLEKEIVASVNKNHQEYLFCPEDQRW